MFEFLTRGVWEFLIAANIAVGLVWAGIRLYKDLARPLPGKDSRPDRSQEVGASPRSSAPPDRKA
ncbi:MAG: hypothetical protein JXB47_13900 [Anaerolineae bacterium]|nr:hypothetical protein [Anaerolineae bacterium]